MPDQALDSLIGIEFSHYRIIEEIGSGGMGVVFRAHDEHLDREVAIKVLHPGTITDESARKHLHKEALALSKLNHPNIATIFDFDTQRGMDFLVMEYIHGVALSERLASGPLPENEVLRLGMQLSDGLAAAHEQGVVHRDLKPGNLLLTSDGRLKILDFGLAKLRQPLAESAAAETTLEAQSISGTFAYMAPEQLMGEEVDARTDIHGAGLVLYEMASGQRPFAEVQSGQLIGAILRRPPAKLRTLNPKASSEMERIIGKCLEKEPENRYQSAKELAVDLQRLQAGVPAAVKAVEVPVARRKLWKILIPAAVIFVAAAIGETLYFSSRRANALTERDTIVLSEFDNNTDDPIFDDALKQAMAVNLGQSPFLNVVSDRKVAATLQMMGRPVDERVTMDLGREICFRTGSKALLGGSIARLGNHFLIDLNAVACTTGDTLAREEGKATSKEDVLKVLSQVSTSLRRKLGESLPSVQKFDIPAAATTSSLEALKNYSMGLKVQSQQGEVPCLPFIKRAIELDPNFAAAYSTLAVVYFDLDQPSLAREYATKAYDLRDRATEKEKWFISASYFSAMGQLDKEAQSYELWIANYPRDPVPHTNLGLDYFSLGRFQEAVAEHQVALSLAPDLYIVYENQAAAYLALDREEDAKASLNQALIHNLDGGFVRKILYYLAFLRGDKAQMEEQLAWGAGKPGDEDPLLSQQSDTEAYYGRLRRARDFSRRAVESALRAGSRETAASWQVGAALREAELGNAPDAEHGVKRALELSPGVKQLAALTLARIGVGPRANALAEELEKSYPTDTLLKFYWLPTIRAAVELRGGNPSQALAYLEAVAPYDLVGSLDSVYVRGEAYLRLRNGVAAATEFQKILDHRGIVLNSAGGAISHLQIGRAYVMAGDTARAKAAYQDFFALWKDADPDIPILIAAKSEYAKLH